MKDIPDAPRLPANHLVTAFAASDDWFDTRDYVEEDVWHDALDYIEIDNSSFNNRWDNGSEDTPKTSPEAKKNEIELIPLTEDCLRSVRQLVRIIGDVKQSEIISECLSGCFPGLPYDVLIAANSLYLAITERKYIDGAILQSLGLATSYLLADGNIISQLAQYIRETIREYVGENYLEQFIYQNESNSHGCMYIALAALIIVTKYWISDENTPDRRFLKLPAFIANLYVRASSYWNALGKMAQHSINVPREHAFDIDTSIEITKRGGGESERLTTFISNSTVHPELFLSGTTEKITTPGDKKNMTNQEQLHMFAIEKHKLKNGISELLSCASKKTETHQKERNGDALTHTHFNTKCYDAIPYKSGTPEPSSSSQYTSPVVTSAKSAAGRRETIPLLPLVTSAAGTVAAAGTCALRVEPNTGSGALKSGVFITAATTGALTTLTFAGKKIYDYFIMEGLNHPSDTPESDLSKTDSLFAVKYDHKTTTSIAEDVKKEPVQYCDKYYSVGGFIAKKGILCKKNEAMLPVKYEYTDDQPEQCKTQTFMNRCKLAHAMAKKSITRMVLNIENIQCFCPPPVGNYEIIPPANNSQKAEKGSINQQHIKMMEMLIEKIVGKVSDILPACMRLLPNASITSIIQLFVVPVLNQSLINTGKSITDAVIEEANQRILFLMKHLTATLSLTEMAMLYESKGEDEAILAKGNELITRLIFKNEKHYVKIGRKEYLFQESNTGIPYVIDNNQTRTIHFSHKIKNWTYIDKKYFTHYTDININKEKFGIPLGELFSSEGVSLSTGGIPDDFMRIKNSTLGDINGVLVDNVLVPAEQYKIGKETITTTTAHNSNEKQVLLNTEFGWMFETPSVAKDNYLSLLLESKNAGLYNTNNKFSMIRTDGFCYNDNGDIFIKHKNKYYSVSSTGKNSYTLSNYTGSKIMRLQNVFLLKYSPEVVFKFKTLSISNTPPDNTISIESEGNEYLKKHGVESSTPIISNIGPGIYSSDNSIVFSVDGHKYDASLYSGARVCMKSNVDGGDFTFLLDNAVYFRVRDEINKPLMNYLEINNGDAATTAYRPTVRITDVLDLLLKQYIESGCRYEKAPSGIDLMDSGLQYTWDLYKGNISGKYYFYYNGYYFYAILGKENDISKLFGKPALQLVCNNDMKPHPDISGIVFDKKETEIQIKTEAEYVSELLNIRQSIASDYLKNRRYISVSGIRGLEDAINQVAMSGKVFVSKTAEIYAPDILLNNMNTILSAEFYPEQLVSDSHFTITSFGLNADTGSLCTSHADAQKMVTSHIEYIKKILIPTIKNAFTFFMKNILDGREEHVSPLFKSNNPNFRIDIYERLFQRMDVITAALSIENITLVSCDSEGYPISSMTEDVEKMENLAFITPDKNRKIFINIDKLHIHSQAGETTNILLSDRLIRTLLEVASQSGGMTKRILHVLNEYKKLSMQEITINTVNALFSGSVINSEDFKEISKAYLDGIPAYRKLNVLKRREGLAFLAENDPGYLAHLLMNSSEALALLIMNLYRNIFSSISHVEMAQNTLIILSPGDDSNKYSYRETKNIIEKRDDTVIYDTQDGYLIQDFNNGIQKSNPSGLVQALNATQVLNCLYGAGSAIMIIHLDDEGGGTVSVKIKKMPGAPLSSLFTLLDSDEVQRDEYKSVLLELTRKDTNLASQLSKKLQEKQIYIHDINAYNLQFDKNAGFYLPGFDATGAVVQQKPLSDDQVDIMTAQITDLLNRFGQRAGIITDIIPPSIKIEDSLITHKKNMYLLQSGGNEVPGKNVQSSTTDAQVDEVNIEKMFDLSCLDERNDMSTTDILRSIGKTMQKPLTNAYMEGEIVVHYEVMKKGCPVSMAGTTKEKILSGIDNVVTGVLSFVPGASPLILLQGIVGPALVKLSDDLSGKEPSSEEMDEINMTLLSMMRQTVPTLSATSRAGLSLSAAEKKALSKKEKVTLAERNLITPRFTLVDNKQGITVSGKVYEFNGGDSDEPFIIVDGQAKEVAFNQNTEQWYFVTEVKGREYISYSEESKNIYGISLEDAIKDKGFFVSVSGFSNKVLTFQHSKFGNFDGVYVDDTIVPINEYKIGDINVVVASVGGEEETVVLIHQDSGWKFEPESVAMDHSTEALLKMQPVKYRYKAQNKFTAIQSDGFCYNEKKEAFIKKDNNYFKVNKSVSEIYSFSERHGDLFTRENGVFQLIYSPDIILGYKSRTIDFYTSREGTLQQNIELAAVDYLNSYAELVSPVKPYTRLGPGVYIEDSGRKIFSVGQNHFEVVDYSSEDGMVTIKRSRHVESQGDIQLYSVDGMYVRVRNENKKQVLEYIEKSFCRIARAPGSSSRCLPVVMTESLNRLLNIFILFDSSSKTILDKGIVDTKIDKFPGLFWNPETGQYYYLHEGQYFHAEILPVGHKLNCINDEVLRIFSKGVLYGKNNIAFMVFEKKNGRIEVKEMSAYNAEKVNVPKSSMDEFARTSKFRDGIDIDSVEHAIKQFLASGETMFVKLKEQFKPEIPMDALNKNIFKKLFSSKRFSTPEYTAKFFNVKEDEGYLTIEMNNARQEVNRQVDFITKDMLPRVIDKISNFDIDYQVYLSYVLKDTYHISLMNFSNLLKERLRIIVNTLASCQILLVTAFKNGEPISMRQENALTPDEKNEGYVAFLYADKNNNMFINMDKVLASAGGTPVADLTSVLIHEASHAAGMTTDITYIPRKNGEYIHISDAIADLIEKIQEKRLVEQGEFATLTEDYVKSIAVYQRIKDTVLSDDGLAYLAQYDPNFLASLLLNSADTLALLSRDIFRMTEQKKSSPDKNEFAYRAEKNILAKGSISTVYDTHDGFVIKDYKHIITRENQTKLRYAQDNVEAMNRIYGSGSAEIIPHLQEDDTLRVSVKMKKIAGKPLSSLFSITDQVQLDEWKTALRQFISKDKNPAFELSKQLQKKGVIHNDINDANLLLDKDKGYSLIDFDSSVIKPEGVQLSDEIANDMATKLKMIMFRFGRFVGIPEDELIQNLDIRTQ